MAAMIASMFAWGCAPAGPPPMEVEATPTAVAGQEITEMDFESGEVEQSTTESQEPAEAPTPEAP